MSFINFRTEKDAEKNALERRLKESEKVRDIKPAKELFEIQSIYSQEKLKSLSDFDFLPSKMNPRFGPAFSQPSYELAEDEEEVVNEEEQKQNLREDFEMLEREKELGEPSPIEVRFEEGEDLVE